MYLGGVCRKCGYGKNITALEFHHIEDNKEFSLSSSTHNKSWDKIKSELDKCILLCANCHRDEHSESARYIEAAPSLIGVGVNPEIAELVRRFIKSHK